MTVDELREEIGIELELIATVVAEAVSLCGDIADHEPTVREKTAAAAFIAQFYGGIENILKRIHRYHGIATPAGDSWHIEIFKRFCNPPHPGLPLLFDESLSLTIAPFRKFRHVVYHGYGFQLEWERMKEGLNVIDDAQQRFATVIAVYLESLS